MSYQFTQICENLANAAAVATFPKLAAFKDICTVFPLEEDERNGNLNPEFGRVIPLAKSISETQIGPSPDYSSGDVALDMKRFNHVLCSQVFGLGYDELNKGARLDWLAGIAGNQIAQKISDGLMSLLTVDNFGAPIVTKESTLFDVYDFDTLYAAVPTPERTIVLDSAYAAKVKSTWLPAGFSKVTEHARWTTAGANVRGFVGDPRALLLSYGQPVIAAPGRNVLAEKRFVIPQIQLAGTSTIYFMPATRKLFGCLSVYIGGSVGDSTALKLLTSA